jgi:hypothetical protein
VIKYYQKPKIEIREVNPCNYCLRLDSLKKEDITTFTYEGKCDIGKAVKSWGKQMKHTDYNWGAMFILPNEKGCYITVDVTHVGESILIMD